MSPAVFGREEEVRGEQTKRMEVGVLLEETLAVAELRAVPVMSSLIWEKVLISNLLCRSVVSFHLFCSEVCGEKATSVLRAAV